MSTFSTTDQSPAKKPSDDRYWCRDHKGNRYSHDQAIDLIRAFHGHVAPGLAIGTKMVTVAMDRLPAGILFDAVCETTSCLPDAVQMLTPCTIGNGWLRIKDLGRYAVTLYDKFEGDGIRVSLDSGKLRRWPEFYDWFYKIKEKQDQDFDRLLEEIRLAGEGVLTLETVKIKPAYLVRRSKGRITTCPVCDEAFPAAHGRICRGCQGEAPCEPATLSPQPGPALNLIPVEAAIGRRALHDMTRIVAGMEKGPAIQSGAVITSGDICRLQKMGRNQVFVEDGRGPGQDWIHENQAALAFAEAMAGEGVSFQGPPREGKINLRTERSGLLVVDTDRLEAFNMVPGVMCAARKSYAVTGDNEEIAGTRAIPLYLPQRDFQAAMSVLGECPLFQVLLLKKARVGILVTGTEVFRGLIQDSFIPIIRKKIEAYGCTVTDGIIVPDDRLVICKGVKTLLDAGTEVLVTTAGLSVDPDDVTRQGLADAGCEDLIYGAPVLPGAMTLLARIGKVQVIGVPACGLYHRTTSFDLLLPRLLAGVTIGRRDLARMGHGAFCRNCPDCSYPKCGFGA
ncbi:MAG: trehalose-binding protein [Desulfobacterales bacterium]|nr:trehalose-binding protein [Desulfobacterales bacterium]